MNTKNTVSQSVKCEHTPTPWKMFYCSKLFNGYEIFAFNGRTNICRVPFAGDVDTANAQFICKAVNCHEELLAALEKCEHIIGMARLQGKLDDSALSPVNDALVSARAVLDKTRI